MYFYCLGENGCERMAMVPNDGAAAGVNPGVDQGEVRIQGSVGAGGKNRPDDVKQIQNALNGWEPAEGGPDPKLVVDGIVGPKTIGAIRKFQQRYVSVADGRVDPGGPTLAKLNAGKMHSLDGDGGSIVSPDTPAFQATVALGQVLLAIKEARLCINAARMSLDRAISALQGYPGKYGQQELDRCQFHFRFRNLWNPKHELYRIRDVFDFMARQQLNATDDLDSFFQGKNTTFVPDPGAGRVKRKAFAAAPGGGARLSPPVMLKDPKDPKGPDYPSNHIFVYVPQGGELADHYVRLAVHELAHFCGPVDGNVDHIPDYAYGWPDSVAYSMKNVTPWKRCRNADSFASFAFDCRYNREWVVKMPAR